MKTIDPNALYITDGGRILHGKCLGMTATVTGRDLSGQCIQRLTREDAEAFRTETSADPTCEKCGKCENAAGHDSDRAALLSRAWDAGNYANAYDTTDYPTAWRHQSADWHASADARMAYILGFFSSYEEHEIPGMWRGDYITAREALHHDPDFLATGIGIDD